MPTKKFWDSIPTEDAVVAGPGRSFGMKDAERIRRAEDGKVVPVHGSSSAGAGPELDREVAEACGYEITMAGAGCCVLDSRLMDEFDDDKPVGEFFPQRSHLFCPSTDLSAAFAAAEKAGLFNHSNVTVSRNEEGQWLVERRLGLRDGETLAIQPTPALAICAAILKLKETR